MSEQATSWGAVFNRCAKEVYEGAKEFPSMTPLKKFGTIGSGALALLSVATLSPAPIVVWSVALGLLLRQHGEQKLADHKAKTPKGPSQEP